MSQLEPIVSEFHFCECTFFSSCYSVPVYAIDAVRAASLNFHALRGRQACSARTSLPSSKRMPAAFRRLRSRAVRGGAGAS
jgi:hypothetical protein